MAVNTKNFAQFANLINKNKQIESLQLLSNLNALCIMAEGGKGKMLQNTGKFVSETRAEGLVEMKLKLKILKFFFCFPAATTSSMRQATDSHARMIKSTPNMASIGLRTASSAPGT